jgi:hypothetical protein
MDQGAFNGISFVLADQTVKYNVSGEVRQWIVSYVQTRIVPPRR